uniref:RING-type domain-containing protein n=1 Tax=Macrostomum lignano TaxID=282301 RepID=A0A1I8HLD1_9PLAT
KSSNSSSRQAKDALAAKLEQLTKELHKKRRLLERSEGHAASADAATSKSNQENDVIDQVTDDVIIPMDTSGDLFEIKCDDNDVTIRDKTDPGCQATVPVSYHGNQQVDPVDVDAESCFACCEIRALSLAPGCYGNQDQGRTEVMCATSSEEFGSVVVLDTGADCVSVLAGDRVRQLSLGRCVVAKCCRAVAGRILLAVAYPQAVALMLTELGTCDTGDHSWPHWQLMGALPWSGGSSVDFIPTASTVISASSSGLGWLVGDGEAVLLDANCCFVERRLLNCQISCAVSCRADGIQGDPSRHRGSVPDTVINIYCEEFSSEQHIADCCLIWCEFRLKDRLLLCHLLSADNSEVLLLCSKISNDHKSLPSGTCLISRFRLSRESEPLHRWADVVCLRPGRLLAIDSGRLHRLEYGSCGFQSACLSDCCSWRLASQLHRLLVNHCPMQLCLLPCASDSMACGGRVPFEFARSSVSVWPVQPVAQRRELIVADQSALSASNQEVFCPWVIRNSASLVGVSALPCSQRGRLAGRLKLPGRAADDQRPVQRASNHARALDELRWWRRTFCRKAVKSEWRKWHEPSSAELWLRSVNQLHSRHEATSRTAQPPGEHIAQLSTDFSASFRARVSPVAMATGAALQRHSGSRQVRTQRVTASQDTAGHGKSGHSGSRQVRTQRVTASQDTVTASQDTAGHGKSGHSGSRQVRTQRGHGKPNGAIGKAKTDNVGKQSRPLQESLRSLTARRSRSHDEALRKLCRSSSAVSARFLGPAENPSEIRGIARPPHLKTPILLCGTFASGGCMAVSSYTVQPKAHTSVLAEYGIESSSPMNSSGAMKCQVPLGSTPVLRPQVPTISLARPKSISLMTPSFAILENSETHLSGEVPDPGLLERLVLTLHQLKEAVTRDQLGEDVQPIRLLLALEELHNVGMRESLDDVNSPLLYQNSSVFLPLLSLAQRQYFDSHRLVAVCEGLEHLAEGTTADELLLVVLQDEVPRLDALMLSGQMNGRVSVFVRNCETVAAELLHQPLQTRVAFSVHSGKLGPNLLISSSRHDELTGLQAT